MKGKSKACRVESKFTYKIDSEDDTRYVEGTPDFCENHSSIVLEDCIPPHR